MRISLFSLFSFLILSFLFKDPFFLKAIQNSFEFYLLNLKNTWSFIAQKGWILNLYKYSHIGFFIEQNPLLVFLISLNFLFIIGSTVIWKKRRWNLSDLSFFLLLLILFFHPEQKLFFICALLPFFLISFFTNQEWANWFKKSSLLLQTLLLALIFIYSTHSISYFSYKLYREKNNQKQKELIKYLNDFYQDSKALIFDPSCLVYKRKTHCKYTLYDDEFYNNFYSYLKTNHFDVVLASQMTNIVDLNRYKELGFQYKHISNQIYYKALVLSKESPKHINSNETRRLGQSEITFKENQEQKNLSEALAFPNISLTSQKNQKPKSPKHFWYNRGKNSQKNQEPTSPKLLTSYKEIKRERLNFLLPDSDIIRKRGQIEPTKSFENISLKKLQKNKIISGKKLITALNFYLESSLPEKKPPIFFFLYG